MPSAMSEGGHIAALAGPFYDVKQSRDDCGIESHCTGVVLALAGTA